MLDVVFVALLNILCPVCSGSFRPVFHSQPLVLFEVLFPAMCFAERCPWLHVLYLLLLPICLKSSLMCVDIVCDTVKSTPLCSMFCSEPLFCSSFCVNFDKQV